MAKTKKTSELSGSNLLIVMLLISLLVVGVTVLVGKTLVGTIIRDTKVVQKKSAADSQLSRNIEAAPQLVASYSDLGSKATTVANALPNTADFPSLIVTLENMGRGAGLRIKSVAPVQQGSVATEEDSGATAATGSLTPTPQAYPFGISFTGSYASLTKLLQEIETSARPMRVLDIQLTGSGSALNGTVNIETYYQAAAELPFGKETVK